MKKRFGIAILVIGIGTWVAYLMSPSKMLPPAPVSQPVATTPPAAAPATNAVVESAPTNQAAVPATPASAPVETNAPETNPPPVVAAPETNPIPAAPVVSMFTNPPPETESSASSTNVVLSSTNCVSCSMVRNLLTGSFTNNLTDNQELFYRFRAGYERGDFGNAENTWYLGAKLYYRPQSWRDELKAGTNRVAALLIPDAFATVEHATIETVDDSGNPSAQEGLRVGVGFFWPWLDWRSKSPDDCPDGDLHFSLGPTVNGGVE
jgi:hypothetical protein